MSHSHSLEGTLERKRFWLTNRWLICRRVTQVLILLGFLMGPWLGILILEGNLSSSMLLGQIPLTDPFVLLQSLSAGQRLAKPALIGVSCVLVLYVILGGRTFCAWVCPVNVVTDSAAWVRRKFTIQRAWGPSRRLRYWLLLACFFCAWLSGSLAWEYVNPVTGLMRGLLFGMGWTGAIVLAIFLFDLFVAQRGWCGHLCPMGAFYGVMGKVALLRVSAIRRSSCTNCTDCFVVCPEPQVISPALKGLGSPLILAADCTNCGRCIDACTEDVFRFTHRFDQRLAALERALRQ